MDLKRASNEERAALCKRYFFLGIPALPLVWLVNAVWFYKYAYDEVEFAEQQSIKFYVHASLIGAVVWAVLFIAWILFYQVNRANGVPWTDYLAFVYPLGHV